MSRILFLPRCEHWQIPWLLSPYKDEKNAYLRMLQTAFSLSLAYCGSMPRSQYAHNECFLPSWRWGYIHFYAGSWCLSPAHARTISPGVMCLHAWPLASYECHVLKLELSLLWEMKVVLLGFQGAYVCFALANKWGWDRMEMFLETAESTMQMLALHYSS